MSPAVDPGWQGLPARFRPYSGFGSSAGPTTDIDNVASTGKAGLTAQYGGKIYDIIVTELIQASSNVLLNSKWNPDLLDSSGRPFFVSWDPRYNSQAGDGLVQKVTVNGPDGTPVSAFRVARDAPQPGLDEGPMLIWDIGKNNAPGSSYSRLRPIPGVDEFASLMPTKVWTKGVNIQNTNANPAAALSARWVNYYSNPDLSKSNVTEASDGSYHWSIGPNNGLGTWDWTLIEHDFVMASAAEMNRNNITMGLHDETAFGELFIYAPELHV
jgi:hypothetical protein